MPPGDAPARRKPAAPPSLAYVLSQVEGADGGLRWHIVFRSGPTSTWEVKNGLRSDTVALDPKRPDYEAEGAAGALARMTEVAKDRERFALALPGDRHVLFVAVLAADLGQYGARL